MRRNAKITRSIAAMPTYWPYVVLYAALAAAFIFLLQRYALTASLESSLPGRGPRLLADQSAIGT